MKYKVGDIVLLKTGKLEKIFQTATRQKYTYDINTGSSKEIPGQTEDFYNGVNSGGFTDDDVLGKPVVE